MMIVPKSISDSESLYVIINDKIYHKKSLSDQINKDRAQYLTIENQLLEVKQKNNDNYLVLENREINLDKDQHTYNIPSDFLKYAKNEQILIKNTEELEGDSRPDDVKYVLNNYEFKLGNQLLWLIGENPRTPNNYKFLAPDPKNSKPQIHKALYENLSQYDDCYEWFVKLYNKNLPGNVLKFILDEEKKLLTLDIELNSLIKGSSVEYIDGDDFSYNRIIFGAPGTGKSHRLENDRKNLLYGTEGNFERVTFHPDYSYAHFVGTYKPISINKSGKDIIYYKYVPGPFLRVLVRALNNPTEKYLLLIEEINRANVAAVFGDVFQLLDRDDNNVSQYPIETSEDMRRFLKNTLKEGIDYKKLKIPNNMYIWATMNSADQGVFMMDTAFKRRWDFEYVGIDDGEDKIKHAIICFDSEQKLKIHWNSLRKAINKNLSSLNINEDKLLGPFFISPKIFNDNDKFLENFKNKVLMYLYEDVAKGRNDIYSDNLKNRGHVLFSEIVSEYKTNYIYIFSYPILMDYNSLVIKEFKHEKYAINIDFET